MRAGWRITIGGAAVSYSTEDWRKRLASRQKLPVGVFVMIACILAGAASIAVLVVTLRKPVRHEIVIEMDELSAALTDDLKTLADAMAAQNKEDERLQREANAHTESTPERDRAMDALIAIWDERDKREKADGQRASSKWFVERVKGKSFLDLGR